MSVTAEQKVSIDLSQSPKPTEVSDVDKKQLPLPEVKDQWQLLHADLVQLEKSLQSKTKLDPKSLWCERLIGWGVLRLHEKEVQIRVNFLPLYWILDKQQLLPTSQLKFLCCELATLPSTLNRTMGAMMVAVIAATKDAEINKQTVFGPIDWSHKRSDLGRRIQSEIGKECNDDEENGDANSFSKWSIASEEARRFLEEKNMCPASINSNFALLMRWCLLALTPAYTNRDSKTMRNPLVLLPPRDKHELPKEVGFYYKRLDAWCRKYGLSAHFFAAVFGYFPPIARCMLTPAECKAFSVEKVLLSFASGDHWISSVEPAVSKCFPLIFHKQKDQEADTDFSIYSAEGHDASAQSFCLDKNYLFVEPETVRPLHILYSARADSNLVWLDFPVKKEASYPAKPK